jgi:uncharacterized protein
MVAVASVQSMTQSIHSNLEVDERAIADFCRRWKITELSLFGSVLRDDFGPHSDVDVMVVFEPDAPWSYWEWPDMIEELEQIFGREVDLVEKTAIRNPFRRKLLLENQHVLYAA